MVVKLSFDREDVWKVLGVLRNTISEAKGADESSRENHDKGLDVASYDGCEEACSKNDSVIWSFAVNLCSCTDAASKRASCSSSHDSDPKGSHSANDKSDEIGKKENGHKSSYLQPVWRRRSKGPEDEAPSEKYDRNSNHKVNYKGQKLVAIEGQHKSGKNQNGSVVVLQRL